MAFKVNTNFKVILHGHGKLVWSEDSWPTLHNIQIKYSDAFLLPHKNFSPLNSILNIFFHGSHFTFYSFFPSCTIFSHSMRISTSNIFYMRHLTLCILVYTSTGHWTERKTIVNMKKTSVSTFQNLYTLFKSKPIECTAKIFLKTFISICVMAWLHGDATHNAAIHKSFRFVFLLVATYLYISCETDAKLSWIC